MKKANKNGEITTSHSGRTKEEALKLPSVTTVIKAMSPEPVGLKFWRRSKTKKQQKYDMNRAASMGTLIHYRILNSLNEFELDQPREALDSYPPNCIELCEYADAMWDEALETKLLRINFDKPVRTEQFCVDLKHGYTGTYDLAGHMEFRDYGECFTVGDLKTSKRAYESHFLQLGAYSLFFDKPPEQGLIISIHPYIENNPQLKMHIYHITKDRLQTYGNEFLSMLRDWHTQRRTHNIEIDENWATLRVCDKIIRD